MKTKTLVLAAAALSACALTASAQSNVYSLNIVGYVNTVVNASPTPGTDGFTLVANPLDNGAGNISSNLVPAGLPTNSKIWVFDPNTGYNFANKKANGSWSTAFTIPPGTGYFISQSNNVAYTNTFVGNVNGAVPGSLTNNLTFGSSGFNLVGSLYPIGGSVTNTGSNSINLPAGLPSGTKIWYHDTVAGYNFINKKANGSWSAPLTVNVGQGFFINNPSNTPVQWIQNVGP